MRKKGFCENLFDGTNMLSIVCTRLSVQWGGVDGDSRSAICSNMNQRG